MGEYITRNKFSVRQNKYDFISGRVVEIPRQITSALADLAKLRTLTVDPGQVSDVDDLKAKLIADVTAALG